MATETPAPLMTLEQLKGELTTLASEISETTEARDMLSEGSKPRAAVERALTKATKRHDVVTKKITRLERQAAESLFLAPVVAAFGVVDIEGADVRRLPKRFTVDTLAEQLESAEQAVHEAEMRQGVIKFVQAAIIDNVPEDQRDNLKPFRLVIAEDGKTATLTFAKGRGGGGGARGPRQLYTITKGPGKTEGKTIGPNGDYATFKAFADKHGGKPWKTATDAPGRRSAREFVETKMDVTVEVAAA